MPNTNPDQLLEKQVRHIVARLGGYRETHLLSAPHTTERDPDTWDDQHKLVNVRGLEPDADGCRRSFAVDLVTGLIVG